MSGMFRTNSARDTSLIRLVFALTTGLYEMFQDSEK